jgi:hypothetical protein
MISGELAGTIELKFHPQDYHVAYDLSAVRLIGSTLWLGSDETAHLERLTLDQNQGHQHQSVAVAQYLTLPHGDAQEIDIEGIAYADHYLWVVGSHSLKRKRVKAELSPQENLDRLETISMEENRYLLGRIPLVNDQLHHACVDPREPSQLLTAAQLKREKHGNQLTRTLRKDPHLGAYLNASIPGKENGFDIEGIAVAEDRIFLGLRGPVLRGWAALLEVQVKAKKSGDLRLKKVGQDGERYLKHFLNLQGQGIRDLCFWGEDLLILAGPTMDLAGDAHIFHLPQALSAMGQNTLLEPKLMLTIPGAYGANKAEGMTLISETEPVVLIVYDSPGVERLKIEESSVTADVFKLPL